MRITTQQRIERIEPNAPSVKGRNINNELYYIVKDLHNRIRKLEDK